MVAELDTSSSARPRFVTGGHRGRSASAGDIVLRSARLAEQTPRAGGSGLRYKTGIFQWDFLLRCGFWTLLAFSSVVGSIFIYDMSQADGSPTGQQPGMQQIAGMIQQMMQEQQRQRERLDELGNMVQGTGVALHGTQQTTETVIQQVVTQVQAGFQQEQQQHQDQMNQVSQAVQALQDQVQQLPALAADQLQQIGQTVQQLQGQMQQQVSMDQVQQLGQAMQSLQSQVHQMSSAAVQPPPAPTGSPQANAPGSSSPPPVFQFGQQGGGGGMGFGGLGGPAVNPAVAYAIQQGGVDGRSLGKPTTYDPVTSKVSLEWIVTAQPRSPLDLALLKVKFPMLDPTLLAYAESNVYAMLSSYTSGEARSLVRQARRPNGMEAFRLLQIRFNPVTIGRQRAHLMKIANPQENIALDKLAAEVVAWENRIVDYEARPGSEKVSEQMKMAALIHMAPNKLREHLQLNAGRFVNYVDLREEVFSYLDQVAPVSQTTMDVGSLSTTKGCYNCGGPHLARDCKSKGKGKSKNGKGKGGKDGFGKGKMKGKSFGKDGKGKKGQKGSGKGPVCSNCGKPGHNYDVCWSKPKALNAVDPKLAEMQSAYAKAALEDYKRISSGASSSTQQPNITILKPPSPSPPASPASPQSATAQVGSLLVRSLCALSRHALGIAERIFGDSAASVVQQHLTRLTTGAGELLVTLDSGAAASVCPPTVFNNWGREAPEEGLSFQAADGSVVPELYKVRPVVKTDEGMVRQTQFSVANVNKVLMSATQVANRGHRIVLQPYYMNSYIEDLATGEQMALHQQDGVYVQRLSEVDMERTAGFHGQAPECVPSVL